jgi:hypothetical protein
MKRVIFLSIFLLVASIFCSAKASAQALTDEQRVQLQQELAKVEAEQKQAALELSNAQQKSASLARDIQVLDAKIRSAQLEIKAKNILIVYTLSSGLFFVILCNLLELGKCPTLLEHQCPLGLCEVDVSLDETFENQVGDNAHTLVKAFVATL